VALLLGVLALGGAAGRADAVDPVMVSPITQSPASNADTGEGPNSVAFSPNGDLLATANADAGVNTVSIFTVNESTGALAPVTQIPASNAATGTSPYSAMFSPAGGLLATANYGSDTVSVFKVDESTGALTPVTQTPASNADTGAAPRSIAFSPDGGLLAVANDNLIGSVSLFTVNGSTGALTPVTQSSPSDAETGSDPDAVTFSPGGGLLATVDFAGCGLGAPPSCKTTGTVSVFAVNDSTGALTPVTQNPTSNADAGEFPEGLSFSPSGGLLATTNQLADTVTLSTINPVTGVVAPVTQSSASNAYTGGFPYGAVFSPAGGLLAAPNQVSNTISLYTVNESTGTLTPDPQSPASNANTGTSPVSLAFSPSGGLIATANSGANNVSIFATGDRTGTGTGTGEGAGTGTGGGTSGSGSGSGSTGTTGAGTSGGSGSTSTETTSGSGAGHSASPIASLSSQLGLPSTKACVSKRKLTIHVAEHVVQPTGTQKIKSAEVLLAGHVVAKLKGPDLVAHVSLVGLEKGSFKITVKATTTAGKTLSASSTFHTCVSSKHKRKKK
jgi:6-phosphogluconolactonase (cycloisomerase 2 family)